MKIRDEFRMPKWSANWKLFLLFAILSFVFAFGLRCLDLPKWSSPSLMVDGEYIMGTHDAYYWLAGAKGFGSAVDNPMSQLVRFLGALTGVQYGNIAFWLPAVFAGFTAIAAFAWGMLIGGPWVGVCGAVFATSIPAYYFRTRLTYYDTDVVTLLFPLLITVLIARWIVQGVENSWHKSIDEKARFQPTLLDYICVLAAGFFASYGASWHQDVENFGLLTLGIATLLVLFRTKTDNRVTLLSGLVLFALVAFWGGWGGCLAVGILAYMFWAEITPKADAKWFWGSLACLALIVLFSGAGLQLYSAVFSKIDAYLKPVVESGAMGGGAKYPGIAQSVIEAQNLSFNEIVSNVTGSYPLCLAGIVAVLFMFVMVPSSLLLLPFFIVLFAAIKMGGRFSMFAGISIGCGFGYLSLWVSSFISKKQQNLIHIGTCFALLLVLLVNTAPMYKKLPVTPIMGNFHVKALKQSATTMAQDSTVWTWWDWGYATTYYTGQHSFADGGHHAGEVLYPLSLAFTTSSPLQSSQLIKFSAKNGNHPVSAWNKLNAVDVFESVKFLGHKPLNFGKLPKQYLVVTWENIRLAYWILYYGSWNVVTGQGIHPQVSAIMNAFNIDFSTGIFSIKNRPELRLASSSFMDEAALQHNSYGSIGPNLIYNKSVTQGFLLDDFAYESLLVRLLVCDPSSKPIASHFKLIYEGFPNVRVYEVL